MLFAWWLSYEMKPRSWSAQIWTSRRRLKIWRQDWLISIYLFVLCQKWFQSGPKLPPRKMITFVPLWSLFLFPHELFHGQNVTANCATIIQIPLTCVGWEEWTSWWKANVENREGEARTTAKDNECPTCLSACSSYYTCSICCSRPSCWQQICPYSRLSWICVVAAWRYFTGPRASLSSCLSWHLNPVMMWFTERFNG